MTDRSMSGGRARWLPAMAALLASVVLSLLTLVVPVVLTADGSSAAPAIGTGWLIALPLVVALVMTRICTDGTLGVLAGAGAVAVGRLLADMGLLFAPDTVLRPELLGVETVRAFPLSPAWGAALPIGADVLAVVAAALAARQVFDGFELPDFATPATADVRDRPRPFRATPAMFVGLVGVALVITASFGVLYDTPVPLVRPLGLADIGLFGAAGAVAGGLVLCLVAVVAPALSPRSARGVFLGAGAAAAVAPLIALAAGGDTTPAGTAWLGLVGAVLLASAGLLVRGSGATVATPAEHAAVPATGSGPLTTGLRVGPVAVAVLALLAAGAALLAYREPQATSRIGDRLASFDAAGAAFLPAAALLALVGVLALLPPTAAIGRRALRLSWLPVVAAVLVTLEFSSSSIWVSSAIYAAEGVSRAAGTWWGMTAAGLAVAAAVLAGVLDGRLAERDGATALDPPDRSDAVRRLRIGVAAGLSVLIVAAFAVPVFEANGRPSAALFAAGSRVDTYAAWLLALGLAAGVWAACLSRSRLTTATLSVTVAVVALTRVVITPAVANQVRFEVRAGLVLTVVLAAATLTASVFLALRPEPASAPAAGPAARGGAARSVGAPRGKRA